MADKETSSTDIDPVIAENLKLFVEPSVNDKPRLYYFDARGRAEIIRYIFSLKSIDYDDIRCRPHPHALSDFALLKKYKFLPFEQLPLLEIDGISLAQSQAIIRYLGKKYELIGDSEKSTALIDMIVCATDDVRQKFTTSMLQWNDLKSQPYLCNFATVTCPQWGGYFESLLQKNGGTWFIDNRISIGDLAVYDLVTCVQSRIANAFSEFKLLSNLITRIEKIEELKKWIAKRPQTLV